MRRLVFDTNIYIDWINQGEHEDVLFQPEAVKYLSSVVLMELRAGAFRARDVRLIERLETTFAKADRLLVPSRRAWSLAGTVLRGLHVERGYNLDGRGAGVGAEVGAGVDAVVTDEVSEALPASPGLPSPQAVWPDFPISPSPPRR